MLPPSHGAAASSSKYGIRDRVPACRAGAPRAGRRGEIAETPKPGDPLFARVRNTVVGSNRLALDAAARARPRTGLPHAGALQRDRGRDARDRAHARRHRARDRAHRAARSRRRPASSPAARPRSPSRAMASAGAIRNSCWPRPSISPGCRTVVVFSAGTDGTRRPHRRRRRHRRRRNPARASPTRAHSWIATIRTITSQPLGDLVITGPTNTNVMDVRLILVGSEK